MRVRAVAAGLLAGWASAALAQGDACANIGQGIQSELNACALQDGQKADEALNAAYREALAWARGEDLDDEVGETEAGLRAAQRAWVAFRDANCVVHPAAQGRGSMAPMLLYGCFEGTTRERARELLSYGGT